MGCIHVHVPKYIQKPLINLNFGKKYGKPVSEISHPFTEPRSPPSFAVLLSLEKTFLFLGCF